MAERKKGEKKKKWKQALGQGHTDEYLHELFRSLEKCPILLLLIKIHQIGE